MATIRAVVDTNALFPRRQRELLQQLAFNGAFIAIWSPYIISDLYRVLTWDQIKRTVEDIEDIPDVRRKTYDVSEAKRRHVSLSAKKMMEVFLRNPNWLLVEARPPYPPAWPSLTDEWDHPIYAAAVEGGASYVVTENLATGHAPDQDVSRRRSLRPARLPCAIGRPAVPGVVGGATLTPSPRPRRGITIEHADRHGIVYGSSRIDGSKATSTTWIARP